MWPHSLLCADAHSSRQGAGNRCPVPSVWDRKEGAGHSIERMQTGQATGNTGENQLDPRRLLLDLEPRCNAQAAK